MAANLIGCEDLDETTYDEWSIISHDPHLELFSKTTENMDPNELETILERSWHKDPLTTLKIIFYLRDYRRGKGYKWLFIEMYTWLIREHKLIAMINLQYIPFYGTYKDWLFLDGTEVEELMYQLFAEQLTQDLKALKENRLQDLSLAGKWAPSEKSSQKELAKKLMKALGVTAKTYRKEYLVPLREALQVPEVLMSSNRWNNLNILRMPSTCITKYKTALERYVPRGYLPYLKTRAEKDKGVKEEMTLSEVLSSKYYDCLEMINIDLKK